MRTPRTQRQPLPKLVPAVQAPGAETGVLALLQEEIRRRAYALYERRGRIDGHAEEDWLRAEAEVLAEKSRLQ